MTDAEQNGAVVTTERRGAVAVLTIDNPPVNAIGAAVRRQLLDAVVAAERDQAVRAILIVGKGRGFLAGADIREFGKPPQPPSLPEVCNRIEACTKPVVASMHGAALGGGLEVAMAAHYRVAQPGSSLGLPEVNIGLLPGAGGTFRAPRLAGVKAALDLMLSGRPIDAQAALKAGLVDRVGGAAGSTPGAASALDDGLAWAEELARSAAPARPTRERTEALADRQANQAALDAARADVAKKSRGLFSPAKIVDTVAAVIDAPFDDAVRIERQAFMDCIDSPQRAGLIHAFFAEREAARSPETRGVEPRKVERTGVVGGGTMGAGIAISMLDAGLHVTMIERDDDSVARGRQNVEKVYDASVKRGRLSQADRDATLARFRTGTDYALVAQADLVVEAVFEEMSVKKGVFAELDRVCKPGAVLATNTSYLDVNEIAASTKRPQDVIGLHFFSPANIMKLLEIVVPDRVAPDVIATGFDLARRLGKVAVRAGVCDGFIGNRILAVYRQAADMAMMAGASPYQIDAALRDFGFAMGPFQVSDLAGGDIGWATRKRRAATRDPDIPYIPIADRLCERGWFGQKTGRGWYRYPDGARLGEPDPEVEAIVADERAAAGVQPRTFTDDEIVRRYMAAMINEGANVVREGIALRPLDVDVVFVAGYGFPRYRGGPMKYADMVGLDTILADIRSFAAESPHFWRPSPLLVELVERNASFDGLNRKEG